MAEQQNNKEIIYFLAYLRRKLSTSYCFFSVLRDATSGLQGSPIGSVRYMDGYFRHPTTREYFQSRISPPVCFKIPANALLQIRRTPNPKNPFGDPRLPQLAIRPSGQKQERKSLPITKFLPLTSRLFSLVPQGQSVYRLPPFVLPERIVFKLQDACKENKTVFLIGTRKVNPDSEFGKCCLQCPHIKKVFLLSFSWKLTQPVSSCYRPVSDGISRYKDYYQIVWAIWA